MKWILILVVIVIIASILYEYIMSRGKETFLILDNERDEAYAIRFSDGSAIIIYTISSKRRVDELERKFLHMLDNGTTDDSNMKKISSYIQLHYGDTKPVLKPVHPVRSPMHGVVSTIDDIYGNAVSMYNEIRQTPVAIAKTALMGALYYNFWQTMILFKYASNDGRTASIVVKKDDNLSKAEQVRMTDYINYVKISSKDILNITRL